MRLGERLYSKPGLREHNRKYNVDQRARRRLRVVLEVLDEYAESVRLAMRERGDDDFAFTAVFSAVRLLVEGSEGQFR